MMDKKKSTPPQPTAADRARSKAQLDSLKKAKPTAAEGKVAGSANRSEGPGYNSGGKVAPKMGAKSPKAKPTSDELERRYDKQREKDLLIMPEKPTGYKKGGKATKFGAAMVKKSADTKGRAMVKMAAGGSASKRADGCAIKGKTKGKMLARGGAAMMRKRDSYGGAEFKKGGSC
jgi:hypothetical protein